MSTLALVATLHVFMSAILWATIVRSARFAMRTKGDFIVFQYGASVICMTGAQLESVPQDCFAIPIFLSLAPDGK
jgi:threonine/homoserine efflux transporter RhtA